MKILIKNAQILQEDFSLVQACVLIQDDKIAKISQNITEEADKVIDASHNLLMPSFKNCHTHSAMTLLKNIADDMPLRAWLVDKIFPFEEQLNFDDVYWATSLALLEYARNGITYAADMYMFPQATIDCCIDNNFALTTIGSCSDFAGLDRGLQSLNNTAKLFEDYKNHALIDVVFGYHAEYTCSDAMLKALAELSSQYKSKIFAHMSETQHEVQECLQKCGKTPLRRALDLGLFAHGGGVYHMVYPQADDIKLLQEYELTVCTNPASNLKLASGIAPIKTYVDSNINVVLGTDGPASNNSLDFFKEMFLCAVLQKLEHGATALSADKVLQIALHNPQKIMPHSVHIKAGATASLILIDLAAPNLQPNAHPSSMLVYSANPSNILMTMSHGKILYHNGNYFLKHSAQKIHSMCLASKNRILSTL